MCLHPEDVKLYSTMKCFRPSRHGSWTETNWSEINDLEYEDYYRIAPAQGVAFVVAGKL